MEKKIKVKVIVPEGAQTAVDHGLVCLTKALSDRGVDVSGGLLGGEFGYGADFENEVFMMRQYYWGECDCGWEEFWNKQVFDEEHADCYQNRRTELERRWANAKGQSFEHGHFNKYAMPESEQKRFDGEIENLCKEMGLEYPSGSAVHCTCGRDERFNAFLAAKAKEHGGEADGHRKTCSLSMPNFLYKPTGAEVCWYKWIGRSQEQGGNLPSDWLEVCLKSLPQVIKK